jgi:hypothetical protein
MKRRPASETPHLDEGCVPWRIASDAQVRAARLDVRALWLLSYIDGHLMLGEVFERAGLPIEAAREGVHDLVRRGIVALRSSEREGAWSLRST